MVYGDGNAAQGCFPLARSVDVTAHELTHAVTENESGLIYSGESGGLNEAMSDIFGAFTEAWVDGGRTGALAVSAATWTIGEDVLPPALRWMNDPAKDGASRDFWTTGAGNVDVHYSSGIANLAFYLLSQGGPHPRGKSTVVVTGIGMEKAIRLFYALNVNYLTPSSNFLAAANASMTAATELGFTEAERKSVADAWRAVGVLPPGGPPPAIPFSRTTCRSLDRAARCTASGISRSTFRQDSSAHVQTQRRQRRRGHVCGFGSRPTLTAYQLSSVPQRQ